MNKIPEKVIKAILSISENKDFGIILMWMDELRASHAISAMRQGTEDNYRINQGRFMELDDLVEVFSNPKKFLTK